MNKGTNEGPKRAGNVPRQNSLEGPVEVRFKCSCKRNSIYCPYWVTVKKCWPKACSGFHFNPKVKCPNRW